MDDTSDLEIFEAEVPGDFLAVEQHHVWSSQSRPSGLQTSFLQKFDCHEGEDLYHHHLVDRTMQVITQSNRIHPDGRPKKFRLPTGHENVRPRNDPDPPYLADGVTKTEWWIFGWLYDHRMVKPRTNYEGYTGLHIAMNRLWKSCPELSDQHVLYFSLYRRHPMKDLAAIFSIAENLCEADMELAVNGEYIQKAKEVLGEEREPQWYKMDHKITPYDVENFEKRRILEKY